VANFLSKIFGPRQIATKGVNGEGQWHPGPYQLPVTGGWLPAGAPWNWWQSGMEPVGSESTAMVEACLAAYSQTVAMCPGDHWRLNAKNGRDRIKTSALSRILRYPNDYQSPSDFMLNLTRSLYADGNAYALALRNDRFEIDSLHLMDPRQSYPQVAVSGDIFYTLAGNHVIDRQIVEPLLVPARDVLHVRLNATRRRHPFPIVGDTPIGAALQDIATSNAMNNQQIQFYLNQARPSAILTTDLVLDKDQVDFLRDRWNEQSKGLNSGGTPILTGGLKPHILSTPSRDAELSEVMKLTEQRIALAFRIPLQILGLGGTSFGSTEALMQSWISQGLGFALNHIEDAFGLLFQLKGQPDEYLEFDTKALLRSAFRDRIDALVRAVQGGVMAPNEARAEESMDAVEFGDEPRVQQQVVPLSAAGAIPAAPGMPGMPGMPPAAGPPQVKPPGKAANDDEPDDEKEPVEKMLITARDYNDVVARELRTLLARADQYDRSNP
jgi:HK97 family phage portal protein